jgi:hypothetical protein
MTTLSEVHDSSTCRLGSGCNPCEACTAAIEYEQRQVISRVHQMMSEDCDCPKHRDQVKPSCCDRCDESDKQELDQGTAYNILAAIENDKRFASLTTVRAAIMDVIDTGCQHADSLTHEWQFNNTDEDFANGQRCDFTDAVCRRIAELQQPPHSFDSRPSDYCSGYADGWAEAHAETLREQNADLREMLRVGRERVER